MSSSMNSTLELTSAIYRRIERQVSALKVAGPFSSAKRSEYHRRAEEIRALYRHLRSLEASQVGAHSSSPWSQRLL
jgi:hypothetical protein